MLNRKSNNPLYGEKPTELPETFDLIEWQTLARQHSSDGAFLYSLFERTYWFREHSLISEEQRDEVCTLIKRLLKELEVLRQTMNG